MLLDKDRSRLADQQYVRTITKGPGLFCLKRGSNQQPVSGTLTNSLPKPAVVSRCLLLAFRYPFRTGQGTV